MMSFSDDGHRANSANIGPCIVSDLDTKARPTIVRTSRNTQRISIIDTSSKKVAAGSHAYGLDSGLNLQPELIVHHRKRNRDRGHHRHDPGSCHDLCGRGQGAD